MCVRSYWRTRKRRKSETVIFSLCANSCNFSQNLGVIAKFRCFVFLPSGAFLPAPGRFPPLPPFFSIFFFSSIVCDFWAQKYNIFDCMYIKLLIIFDYICIYSKYFCIFVCCRIHGRREGTGHEAERDRDRTRTPPPPAALVLFFGLLAGNAHHAHTFFFDTQPPPAEADTTTQGRRTRARAAPCMFFGGAPNQTQ